MGKKLANICSSQMKHYRGCRIGGDNANSTKGNNKKRKKDKN